MRILLIECEQPVRNLKHTLEEAGYAVDEVHSGKEAESLAGSIAYDLIILDVFRREKASLEICQSLRQKNKPVPLLMLGNNTTEDTILGLDSGADDYLGKPFTLEELYARAGALSRRKNKVRTAEMRAGDLVMDTSARRVYLSQKEIELTRKEYAILEELMHNPGRVLSRADLEQHVWNITVDCNSNLVDTHIKRLRRKLGREGQKSRIETLYGLGYRLRTVSLGIMLSSILSAVIELPLSDLFPY